MIVALWVLEMQQVEEWGFGCWMMIPSDDCLVDGTDLVQA
jgi:hypothetical protein